MNLRATFEPNTPGAFLNVPMEVYRSAPGLSKSELALIGVCPRLFNLRHQYRSKQTDAMAFGTILHAALLEDKEGHFYVRPDTYGADGKRWNANATECKQWLADHADKPVISREQWEQIVACQSAAREHHLAGPLIQDAQTEVSLFANYAGRLLKGRADIFAPERGYIADVKTVADASDRALSRSIFEYDWHVQAGFYWKLAQLLKFPIADFYIIALQKEPVPLVNCKRIKPEAMELGLATFDSWLETLDECEASGFWPDYSGTKIEDIDVPHWAYTADEEALELLQP